MAKKAVTVKLNNVTYNMTTDDKGIAILPIDLPIGTFTAEINFAGSDNYAAATSNATITVGKITTALTATNKNVYLQAIAKGSKYQVTLKDANGKAIAGKEIIVSFNVWRTF